MFVCQYCNATSMTGLIHHDFCSDVVTGKKKPPLGAPHRKVHERIRIVELCLAIIRYMEQRSGSISEEDFNSLISWSDEIMDRISWLKFEEESNKRETEI